MTPNEQTVQEFLDGFRQSDHARILACITDDVEWTLPGLFHARGKKEFEQHIVDAGFRPNPTIDTTRLLELNNVVVAEGHVRTQQTNGTVVNMAFCDVYELKDARIVRLTSYLMMETKT